MYKRIVIPLDGSELAEQALPYVHAIAKGLGATVELLNVIDLTGLTLADPRAWTFLDRDSLKTESEKYLEKAAWPLRAEAIPVTWQVQYGSPASVILAEAEKEPATLIAMTTHGRSGFARWIIGSTAEKILHASTVPLLVIRSREQPPQAVKLSGIIVPLDGSPLAEHILPHVVPLAKRLLLNVVLVRVIPSEVEYHRYLKEHLKVGPGPILSREFTGPYEEFSQAAAAQAMEYLHQVGDRLKSEGVLSVEERLLQGEPADAIIRLAQEVPDNLVAMTTHGRSGIGRLVMGSVANRVVRYSGDPVLLVRASRED